MEVSEAARLRFRLSRQAMAGMNEEVQARGCSPKPKILPQGTHGLEWLRERLGAQRSTVQPHNGVVSTISNHLEWASFAKTSSLSE